MELLQFIENWRVDDKFKSSEKHNLSSRKLLIDFKEGDTRKSSIFIQTEKDYIIDY